MTMTPADTATTIMFAIYLVAMLLIGWLGYRATSNLSDYILGGRSLGSFVTALSAGASDMSGWLLMGLPGAVYASGLSESWIAIGLCIGAWLNWYFVAGRLRVYTEKVGNALTMPDYFTNRFEDHSNLLRIFTAVVILVFFTLYCASGVVAGARLFESMFGMPYSVALWVGALCTIAYVFIGGFLAVSWTDTIQASLMIGALILAPLMVIYNQGGVTESIQLVEQIKPGATSLMGDLDTLAILSLAAWGLGYFGQPHIIVRFMALRTPADAKSGRRIGISWMVLTVFGALSGAFMGIAYFARHPEASLTNPETAESVFLDLSQILFHPFIAGLILSAVLAAIMSTLSSQLIVCSSALVEDLYGIFSSKKLSAGKSLWLGRAGVAIVALVAGALAWNPNSSILQLVAFAWAGFGSAFGPTVLLSLYWRKLTTQGALASMITGAVVAFAWGQSPMKSVLYEMVPGFASALLVAIVVSLMTYKKNDTIDEEFDRAVELAKVK